MRVGCLVLAVLALSGCSQIAESRMEDALVDAGLPPKMAGCMAERMSDRLTFNQMRKLTRLKAAGDEANVPLTIPDFLERARRVNDPEALEVAAAAAAVCAFRGV